jgi:xylulokinase
MLNVVSVKEATALGAAILGGLAAGVYPDLPAALRQLRYTQTAVAPEVEAIRLYEAAFRTVYQPLYATLRPLHHALGAVSQ